MKLLLSLLILAPVLLEAGEIETKYVTYQGGTVQSKGYLALPKAPGPHPGVLVLHEWWGQNEFIRERTEELAELGYAALALDLFGEGKVAHDPQTGWSLMMPILNHTAEMSARFKGGMECLMSQDGVDREKIAAVGYSFGGTVGVQMARNGTLGLAGVVAFHPTLQLRSPNPPIDQVGAKVLVCHGGESVFVRPGMKDAFLKELKAGKTDLKFVEYPTAMDSFTNPEASKLGEKFNIPLVYDPVAAAAAWAELEDFLKALWENPAVEG